MTQEPPPGQQAAEAMTRALQQKAEEGDAPASDAGQQVEPPGIHHAEREAPPREQGSPGQQGQNPEGAGGPGPPTKFA